MSGFAAGPGGQAGRRGGKADCRFSQPSQPIKLLAVAVKRLCSGR
jgi:hypothetical protein